MKKILFSVLLIIFSLCVVFCITSCGNEEETQSSEEPYEFTTETIEALNQQVYVFNGHYYLLYAQKLSWADAEISCELMGGHLATVGSADENKFIINLIKKYNIPTSEVDTIHLGLIKKDSGWSWVTGEEFSFTYWSQNEPNNSASVGGIWNNKYNFGWDDREETCYYICEWDSKENIGNPNYYYINKVDTAEKLQGLSNSDKTYVLTTDIDLSSIENWTPIENFTGTLIGNGKSISNLKIDALNIENIGLFKELKGTVKDLMVTNANVTARGDAGKAGIIAGTNSGTIENVTVSGVINPEYYNFVGGFVGYNSENGKVLNCTNQASVTGAERVGGLVGSILVNKNGVIDGNKNEGIVVGRLHVGGVAGYITCVRSNATYIVTQNTNKNTVSGDNHVGGIFGEVYAFYENYRYNDYNSYFEMSVLVNEGEITGSSTGYDIGGLIGKAQRLTTLTICENKADVSGGRCVGGFVGYAPSVNIKATGAQNNNTITGTAYIGGFAGYAGIIENATNNGEIISNGVTVEDGVSKSYVGGVAGYCEGLIGCKNNIDITVQTNGWHVGGLAGYICVYKQEAVSGNSNFGSVTGYIHVGGIAGNITCTRSNATYKASANENVGAITGTEKVGGIFGQVYAFYESYRYNDYNSYFEMSVLTNSGEVVGDSTYSYVGGLIGCAQRLTILTTCENKADVTGGHFVGGFVGSSPDTNIKATGAQNNNTITGVSRVGGFAGECAVIEYATNNGTVIATGKADDDTTYLGGIAGICRGAIGCVNNIDIKSETGGSGVGGITGFAYMTSSESVRDNVNYGKVEGADRVGGIAGYVSCPRSNATYRLTNNQNKNAVKGNSCVGGIAGYVYGFYESYRYNDYNSYFEIVNSANEAEITGTEKVGGICGGYQRLKTDANLMDTNTTTHGEKLGE